jgi:hypothetical protein
MNNDVPWYVSLIVSWLPFIMFISAIAWSSRQLRKSLTASDGRSLAQVVDDLAREMKRVNDARDDKTS